MVPVKHYSQARSIVFQNCEGTHPKTLDKQKKRWQLSLFKTILIRGRDNVACLKPITNFHFSFPHLNSLKILQRSRKSGGLGNSMIIHCFISKFYIKKICCNKKLGNSPPPLNAICLVPETSWARNVSLLQFTTKGFMRTYNGF